MKDAKSDKSLKAMKEHLEKEGVLSANEREKRKAAEVADEFMNVTFQIHWKGNAIGLRALPDSQARENHEKANRLIIRIEAYQINKFHKDMKDYLEEEGVLAGRWRKFGKKRKAADVADASSDPFVSTPKKRKASLIANTATESPDTEQPYSPISPTPVKGKTPETPEVKLIAV